MYNPHIMPVIVATVSANCDFFASSSGLALSLMGQVLFVQRNLKSDST